VPLAALGGKVFERLLGAHGLDVRQGGRHHLLGFGLAALVRGHARRGEQGEAGGGSGDE
jgi:hypothetical protein